MASRVPYCDELDGYGVAILRKRTDCVLIAAIGAGVVRRFYRRHALWVTRVSGILFLGFGLHAIVTALHGVWPRTGFAASSSRSFRRWRDGSAGARSFPGRGCRIGPIARVSR